MEHMPKKTPTNKTYRWVFLRDYERTLLVIMQ